jgi:quinoprotein relay system zinc metallohydrolase 1
VKRRAAFGGGIGSAIGIALGAVLLALAAALGAQAAPGGVAAVAAVAEAPDRATLDYRLRAQPLAPGVWVVPGANADFAPANGCNIVNTAFVATGEGVLVINTGPSRRYGEQLRALIARTTPEPVVRVLHLNLHPDYFLGNQAFADVPRFATAATRAGIAREAKAYEDNLYRLCGEWMKGTEALAPDREVQAGEWRLGSRRFTLVELGGHTNSDLVLKDEASGIVFAGGLVFVDRVPTTPHAKLPAWFASLDRVAAMQPALIVPAHGPARAGAAPDAGIEGTRRYLRWLDERFRTAAARGLEMNELLRLPVPPEIASLAAFGTEYVRNVAHLYPRYEDAALGRR